MCHRIRKETRRPHLRSLSARPCSLPVHCSWPWLPVRWRVFLDYNLRCTIDTPCPRWVGLACRAVIADLEMVEKVVDTRGLDLFLPRLDVFTSHDATSLRSFSLELEWPWVRLWHGRVLLSIGNTRRVFLAGLGVHRQYAMYTACGRGVG